MRTFRILAFGFVASTGCAKSTPTPDVDAGAPTSALGGTMTVIANGSGDTTVRAWFTDTLHSGDPVTLNPMDALFASVPSQRQAMTYDSAELDYKVVISGFDQEGVAYTIALTRGGKSAPSSTCTLPATLVLQSPQPNAPFSRANDDIAVMYTGSGHPEKVSWGVDGACVDYAAQAVPDTGAFTIPKGTVHDKVGAPGGTCTVTLALERTRLGMVDPAFASGTIRAVQRSVWPIMSRP